MTKSQQKKLASAVIGFIILLLGAWQVSTKAPTLSDSGSLTSNQQPATIFTSPEGYTPLSRVVDGDTIEVAFSSTDKYKVRMIGINTPEVVDPRKPVECFGKEASEHLKQLLNVKYIRLSTDPSQMGEDKYGRWLRYVYLEDGTDVNLQMIKDGYAYEYTYETPYTHQAAYRAAEKVARENKIGLWSPDTCNGKL